MTATFEEMVNAIRNNTLVGRGNCSRIDECVDNADLIVELSHYGVETVEDAVKWALDDQEFFLEQGLDQRWGEDDDPQLVQYNAFMEARKQEAM